MSGTKENESYIGTEIGEIPRNDRYTIREEPFGYTLYDRKPLNASFVRKEKLNETLAYRGIDIQECTFLPALRKNYRSDILYSPYRIYFVENYTSISTINSTAPSSHITTFLTLS